ncbi:hypothetical protein MD484_g6647, partial [Candolleomyces efflorescens]
MSALPPHPLSPPELWPSTWRDYHNIRQFLDNHLPAMTYSVKKYSGTNLFNDACYKFSQPGIFPPRGPSFHWDVLDPYVQGMFTMEASRRAARIKGLEGMAIQSGGAMVAPVIGKLREELEERLTRTQGPDPCVGYVAQHPEPSEHPGVSASFKRNLAEVYTEDTLKDILKLLETRVPKRQKVDPEPQAASTSSSHTSTSKSRAPFRSDLRRKSHSRTSGGTPSLASTARGRTIYQDAGRPFTVRDFSGPSTPSDTSTSASVSSRSRSEAADENSDDEIVFLGANFILPGSSSHSVVSGSVNGDGTPCAPSASPTPSYLSSFHETSTAGSVTPTRFPSLEPLPTPRPDDPDWAWFDREWSTTSTLNDALENLEIQIDTPAPTPLEETETPRPSPSPSSPSAESTDMVREQDEEEEDPQTKRAREKAMLDELSKTSFTTPGPPDEFGNPTEFLWEPIDPDAETLESLDRKFRLLDPPIYPKPYKLDWAQFWDDMFADSVGKEITNMITHGKNITHSLSIASRILCKLAAHDLDHTRTVAWVASIIYARLESDHEKLAWDFRLELGERVQREFKSAWISATEDSRDHTGSLPWIKKDRNTHEYLQGISAAVADFYAMDLVPCQAFRDAIQHIVDRFTQRNHLLCLLIMLSRANSHFGKSLPHTFYQDLMWEWQENAVLRLCQGLIQHANDDLSDEAEIGMPYSYIHSDDLNTEAIFSVAQDELDELKLLDIRYLKETQVELAPPSASKATSINNVDAPTIDENPLGDSTLYDDDDDEYVCLEDWFAGSPETMSEVGCTDRVLTYVIEGPESAKSSTTDLADVRWVTRWGAGFTLAEKTFISRKWKWYRREPRGFWRKLSW